MPIVNLLRKISLPFAVFLTGACVLVIEIVATRILSPYFGNTIYSVSSVISVVLAALSVGYYVGGKLADRYPTENVFYGVILLAGLSVLLLQLLNRFLLPLIGYNLSIVSGPLITAVALFFLPSFLLGTLSPYAIKLQEARSPRQGIGSISGGIYFWSTLGSIFGSLSAGFFLIPRFGLGHIILAVAALLTVLGLVPLVRSAASRRLMIIVPLIGLGLALAAAVSLDAAPGAAYSRDGLYQRIAIFDGDYEGRPARFFRQDRSQSGAMFLDSGTTAYDYTKYYALYRVFKPDLKKALIIGGGAYLIPKALLAELPDADVEVSEIEPSLFELSRQYFGLPDDPRLKNRVEDGRRLLHDSDAAYDLIFSDVYYSLYSVPVHFTTKEFFLIAKEKLNSDGLFIANLIGDLSRRPPSLILAEMKTFRAVFPNSYFFAVRSPGSAETQNIIFVGYNSVKKVDVGAVGDGSDGIIGELAEKLVDPDRFDLAPYPELTDDFAPVEYMTAKVLERGLAADRKAVDGEEMFRLIIQQLGYGPRYLGSPGHARIQAFLRSELAALAPEVKVQEWTQDRAGGGRDELTNIVASFYPDKTDRVILAAHYDSKRFASRDETDPLSPVPGANDPASGVAVLLEAARFLANTAEAPPVGVDLVFFDGEEGDTQIMNDYSDWRPLGSTYFADKIGEFYPQARPKEAVVLEMVCAKDLKIFKERSSMADAPAQTDKFWSIAEQIGPGVFQPAVGQEIRADHTPLNAAGVPSVLVIGYDYPQHHTSRDVAENCSARSLETVGAAVLAFLYSK